MVRAGDRSADLQSAKLARFTFGFRVEYSVSNCVQEADLATVWQSLIDDTQRPVWVVDTDGRVQFANACCSEALGRPAAELVGRSVRELLPEAIAEERARLFRHVATGGRPVMLIEMVGGRWCRTVMRRLSARSSERPFILIIQHLGSGASGAPRGEEYDVVHAESHDAGTLGALSRRELEVLTLVGEGLNTAEIANRLHRTVKTVEWHRASLGRKLGVANRVELAQIAIAAGLSSAEPRSMRRAGAPAATMEPTVAILPGASTVAHV